jgi:hypothetical protein
VTHRQIIETTPRATWLEPSSCPGELVSLGTFPDAEVFRCCECNARIALGEGVIRNVYLPPAPTIAVSPEGRLRCELPM